MLNKSIYNEFQEWQSKEAIQKAYLSGIISEDQIEKAWTKHPIGTVITRKDGQKYKKVSETGDSAQDWKLVTKDKTKHGEPESKGNSKAKVEEDNNTKAKPEDLKESAKNTSEQALKNAVSQSPEPEVREAAHQELDRREKEEKPQEEDKEIGGKKVGSEFKVSVDKNSIVVKNEFGELNADIKGDNIVVFSAAINNDKRGTGEGKKMYEALIDKAKEMNKNVASYYTLSADSLGMWHSLSKKYEVVKNPKTKIYSEEFKKRGIEMPEGVSDFASTGDSGEPCFTLKLKEEKSKKENKKPIKKSETEDIAKERFTCSGGEVIVSKGEENQLKGGKADKLSLQQIADKHEVSLEVIKKQVHKGVKVEMEHTDNSNKALEIVMDHLVESAQYYTKLKEMEDTFEKEK